MRLRADILILTCLLAGAATAGADLTPATWNDVDLPDSGRTGNINYQRPVTGPEQYSDSLVSLEASLNDAVTVVQRPAAEPREVTTHQLPPSPNSTCLFFYAMGGVGAWQLGRSAKKIHLGSLPQWYHSGGPSQIGHAVVFDPNFAHIDLCHIGPVDPDGTAVCQPALRQSPPRRDQSFLTIQAPRAPPIS